MSAEFLLGDDLRITFDKKGVEIETFDKNDDLVIGTVISHEEMKKLIRIYKKWEERSK